MGLNNNKMVLFALTASSMMLSIGGAQAEVTANAAITSNYIFHGVTQSDSGPALQGGLDYGHESGLYLGTWASNVDIGDESGLEVDFYGGVSREVGDFSYNVGAVTYQYTNSAHGHAEEVYFGGAYKMLHATYVFGDGYDYAELVADTEFSGYTLNVRLGNTMNDDAKDVVDYGISIGRAIEMFDVKAGVASTNAEGADTEFFVSLSKGFNL